MYGTEMEIKILGQLDIYYLYYTGALHSTLSNIVTCLLELVTHRDDDVAGPEPALVGGAVRVDLAQHQVQSVLIAVNNLWVNILN